METRGTNWSEGSQWRRRRMEEWRRRVERPKWRLRLKNRSSSSMDPPSTLAMCSLARGETMDERAAGPPTRCVMCDLDYMLLRTDERERESKKI